MYQRPMGGQAQYVSDGVGTASPGKLLVMLYDRLILDLDRAEIGCRDRNVTLAHDNLVHAQAIIHELRSTLRMDIWDGAQNLADLYGFMLTQLAKANMRKDAKIVGEVRSLVMPLRDAWATAAESTNYATAGMRQATA